MIGDKVQNKSSGLSAVFDNLPPPRRQSGVFSVEDFIHSIDRENAPDLQHKMPVLVRLTRKVEIAKVLYAFYSADLSKPVSDSVVTAGYAGAFCGLCLLAAAQLNDLRSLNCALKMLDGILLRPQLEPAPPLERLAAQLVG